jgi:hypothetical protein
MAKDRMANFPFCAASGELFFEKYTGKNRMSNFNFCTCAKLQVVSLKNTL